MLAIGGLLLRDSAGAGREVAVSEADRVLLLDEVGTVVVGTVVATETGGAGSGLDMDLLLRIDPSDADLKLIAGLDIVLVPELTAAVLVTVGLIRPVLDRVVEDGISEFDPAAMELRVDGRLVALPPML